MSRMGVKRGVYKCNKTGFMSGTSEYQKARRKMDPDRFAAYDRKSHYGISKEQYDMLLEQQQGKCAICHSPQTPRFKYLAVDHTHKTSQIRGLLCNNCNRGLGMFKENPEILREAINYLCSVSVQH